MAYLIPDNVLRFSKGKVSLTIKQKITPDDATATKYVASYVGPGDPVKPVAAIGYSGVPLGITVHNTEDIVTAPDTTPAEQYARATYPNLNSGGIAVHYWVWHSDIWQQLSDNEQGWHASDGLTRRTGHRGTLIGGNLDTVSIECIGSDSETVNTTAMLAAYLAYKYGLDPKYDIYTHNWWMHGSDSVVPGAKKNCPLYILDEWDGFISRVNEYCVSIKEDEPMTTAEREKFNELESKVGALEALLIDQKTKLNALNDQAGAKWGYIDGNLPSWAKPTIRKLYGKGILKGDSSGNLQLSYVMLRMLVILDRAGVFD